MQNDIVNSQARASASHEESQMLINTEQVREAEAPPSSQLGRPSNEPKVYKRLMIKQIELTNFKSYYGTRTIGPFHKNFTAVVGPNGSGKSNTIESLLFVFGKRAKQMRLNKLSELIHRSAKHPDCEKAEVQVTF